MKLNAKKLFSIILFFLITLVKFSFADAATANIPVIISGQGLTPIKYAGGKWIDTTNLDQDWYDYENGVWANAGLGDKNIDGEYEIKYVWIPRFTYKIENDNIKIKWSNGKIDDISDGYLRHPAFFFGEYVGGDPNNNSVFIDRTESRNELTGFWIQKDLFSENVTDVSKSFNDALKMTSSSKYKLPQAGMYPHMVKASEWGALAYLTEAKGKATNNRSTNNQTGVFLGDESEYVAGVNAEASSSLVAISSILNSNYRKYRDKLTKDLSSYYGYALTETSNRTQNSEPVNRDQFLVRGGTLGWFGYTGVTGNDGGKGYRTSISIITEELTDTISFFDTETSVVSGDYLILGVDFFVNVNDWTFPENPDKFFKEVSMGELGDKKVVDIECIYETDIEWRLRDVNASVVKLIDPDLNTIPLDSIDSITPHKAGKYTLIVKVGGVVDDTPVFMPMDNADVKIVVNELNLKDSNGIFIKIGNIPNNKVRLNVYGNSGSIVITNAILKKVPEQRKYALEEPLNVNDGIIVPYFGNWKGEEVPVNIENVLNPDITKTSGTHKVELQYNGILVKPDPETKEEFIITVSKVKQVDVQGEVKVGTTVLNSKLLKGPGKYSRTDIDSPKDLTTHEFLNGYMFIGWDSNSTIVKANENSNKTTFTIPNEDAYLDTESVLITANYISPDSLNITNQKKEFIVGEDFSLGNGKLTVTYKNGQIQKEITLNELGLTVSITGSNKEHELTNLQEGDFLVTINYAEKTVSYPITVVKKKYGLNLSVNLTEYGTIKGKILNGTLEKDTIVLNSEGAAYKQVSYDNTVTLTAEPKTGYTLKSWTVEGPEGLIAEEDKTKLQISFIMPQESVKIKANFTTAYTVTFKIKEGQEECGSLEGEKVQVVIAGEDASTVTVKVNDGFVFSKWLDSEENLISNEASLTRVNINEDQEFIAVFDDVWTVKFYNGDTIFKTKKVSNGKSGFIEEEPTKDKYVFMGWYPTPDSDPYTDEPQDLSSITSDINTYAVFVPRIDIKENTETEAGTIDATITGTMIKEGTFKYIISPSAEKPDGHFTNYELDDVFSGFTESDWENTGTMYRNKVVIDPGADSSAFLTITSSNAREIVCFDYILSTSGDSQLGITINGERVITPAEYVGPDWEVFEEDVEVIDGKITLGISYSQGESFDENDYAAIKNLGISNEWTIMDNHDGYHLIITPTPFEQNYIHVKGTGSDDDEVYRAVSECFVGIVKESYTITYDANGGINPPEAQTKTYNVDLQLSSIAPTRYGYEFLGWDTDKEAAYPNYKSGEVFNKNVDITLFAVWASVGETYIVSYDAIGGIGEPVDQIKDAGVEILLSNTIPTKPGYIFTCWNTAVDGTGTSYQPGGSYTVDADVILYAIWEVDETVTLVPTLAPQDTWYTGRTSIPKSSITSIYIEDSYTPAGTVVASWDASAIDSQGPITAYVEEVGADNYKLTLAGNGAGKIYANSKSAMMFESFSNVTTINGFNDESSVILDTSNVTDMGSMFRHCSSLTNVDVSKFDTSNVTEIGGMFWGCSSLVNVDVSNFDTSNVTATSYMFIFCSSLTNVDVSKFDTSNVTDMYAMFWGCSSLTNVDVSNFDTSNVTHMGSMFSNCSSLANVDVSKFDTSNVTNMGSMFHGCSSLTNVDVSKFDTSNVTNMGSMFHDCSSLTNVDVSNLDTSNVTDMGSMFSNCSSLANVDVSKFDTSNVTDMRYMFSNCSSLANVDVSKFDTSNVTYMSYMFHGCNNLTTLNISNFNTISIESSEKLSSFASGCTALTKIILGENFVQDKNMPIGGYPTGLFYVSSITSITVTGANSVMQNYDWAADNRKI